MWSTETLQCPRGRSKEAKFSERLWGRTADEYMGSIIDLTEEQCDKILAKANSYVRDVYQDSDDEEFKRAELPTTGRVVLMHVEVEGIRVMKGLCRDP